MSDVFLPAPPSLGGEACASFPTGTNSINSMNFVKYFLSKKSKNYLAPTQELPVSLRYIGIYIYEPIAENYERGCRISLVVYSIVVLYSWAK
jgi:hypothetical protein